MSIWTTNAPHWFLYACLAVVAIAYLGVAVTARVALYRLTRIRRGTHQPINENADTRQKQVTS